MATVDLSSGGAHAPRDKPLQLGMDGAVVLAHNVPARFRLPCRSFKLLIEEVRVWYALDRPNKFLFRLRQV